MPQAKQSQKLNQKKVSINKGRSNFQSFAHKELTAIEYVQLMHALRSENYVHKMSKVRI